MPKTRNHRHLSHGFAHVGLILLIALVIVILTLGAWYVWLRQESNTINQTEPSQTDTAQQNLQNETSIDPAEGGKYLVIEEWGVRFELPEDLRGDVEYGVLDSSNGQSAHILIGAIDRLPDSNCDLIEVSDTDATGKYGGVISVQKSNQSPEQYSKIIEFRYSSATVIEDHWYYIFPMRDSCFSAPDDEFTFLIDKIHQLAAALKTLEPIPRE